MKKYNPEKLIDGFKYNADAKKFLHLNRACLWAYKKDSKYSFKEKNETNYIGLIGIEVMGETFRSIWKQRIFRFCL